jgi:hypothetical protein
MRNFIRCTVVVASLAWATVASANVITYNFTSTVGNGSFSFDDSNTTTVPAPGGGVVAGAVWYDAVSFVFGGFAQFGPVIGVYDDVAIGGSSYDCLAVFGGLNAGLSLCGATDLWSGTQLSNLDALSTSDFTSTFVRNPRGNSGTLTSLTRAVSVPEPATLALIALGLTGLGFARRRAT